MPLAALVLLSASSALAQPSGWMLLPVGEEGDAAATLAYEARTALEQGGITLIDDEGGTLAFEQDVSAPARSLTQSDIDQWADRSRSALQALARADYDTARSELLQAQEVAQQAAEELNREAERARQVLDTCLFMARTFLETGERSEALRQVRACRVLVPELEPRRNRHTPEMHELLDRVAQETSGSDLEVTSSPTGCVVRVNGTAQGETPFTMRNIARGDYRIQVECDQERGRVHRVRIDEGENRVHVDTGFDQRLDSRPVVHAPAGFNADDARMVAAKMSRTILVVARDAAEYRFYRVDASGDITQVRASPGTLPQAASALREGLSVDVRSGTPVALNLGESGDSSAETEEPDAPSQPAEALPTWRLGTGLAAVAAGGGLFGVSLFLHFDRARIGDAYSGFTDSGMIGYPTNSALWRGTTLAPTAITAFGGMAVLGAGVGLLIPRMQRVPAWAWVIGGVGVALAGASIIPLVTRPECVDVRVPDGQHADCVENSMAGSRATLIAAAALPLLAVPISALIQSGTDSNARVSFQVTPQGATLSLSGSL